MGARIAGTIRIPITTHARTRVLGRVSDLALSIEGHAPRIRERELYENLGKTGIKLQFKESREAVPSHPDRFEREGSPMKYQILTLLLITPLALSSLAAGQESSALSLKTQIALPSVKGRIDHLSVDVKGQRLFVAAVESHTLQVIDLKAGHHVRTIA